MLDKNINYELHFKSYDDSEKFQEFMFSKNIFWCDSYDEILKHYFICVKYYDNKWILCKDTEALTKITEKNFKKLFCNPLKIKIRKLKKLINKK